MSQIQNARTPTPGDRGVSRRTIAGAAAWSLPAIVLVASSPAAAASGPRALTAIPPTITIDADTTRTVEIQVGSATESVVLAVVVETAGALSWTPGDPTIPADTGSASITFSTTLTERQEVSVTVTAVGFQPVVVPVAIEAPATVLSLGAPGAPVNLARNLPMLDHRQDMVAQLTRRDGTPVAGEAVTLSAPEGTTFADGGATFAGVTDGEGKVTATLVAPDRAPASTKKLTATSRSAAEAAFEFIVIGPEQTVAFDLPDVQKGQAWNIPAGVWIATPDRVTGEPLDIWLLSSAGPAASGTWLTGQVASLLGWVQPDVAKPGYVQADLKQAVAARAWVFTFRNISGASDQSLTMSRSESIGDNAWEVKGTYPFTLH